MIFPKKKGKSPADMLLQVVIVSVPFVAEWALYWIVPENGNIHDWYYDVILYSPKMNI